MKKIAIIGLLMAISGGTYAADSVNCEDTGTEAKVSSDAMKTDGSAEAKAPAGNNQDFIKEAKTQ